MNTIMQRVISLILSLLLIAFLSPTKNTQAAKKFVKKTSTSSASKGSIPAFVRYRSDKLGILLSFNNFSGIEAVSYSFTYKTNGITQGIGGQITPNNNPTASRELLFGTCSTSVCTYHYNLSGAKLVLTAKLTNGKTVIKSFRIKTYR